jgi:hypothetical protein
MSDFTSSSFSDCVYAGETPAFPGIHPHILLKTANLSLYYVEISCN